MAITAEGDSFTVEGRIITPPSASWSDGYIFAEYVPTIATPQDYLRKLAGDDFELLNCIAEKESKWQMIWNYMNKEGDPNSKWSAYGYFQILESTARDADPELDRMKPFDNVELAVKVYRKSGIKQWLVWPQCVKIRTEAELPIQNINRPKGRFGVIIKGYGYFYSTTQTKQITTAGGRA